MPRITDYLTADHERLHLLLATASAGATVDAAAYAAFRAGLLRHIGIEEKLLFPAVRAAHGDAPLARVRGLHVEHAAISTLLVPAPDLALCGELAYLLGRHDAQEEGPEGLYAECERLLGDVASRALGQRALDAGDVRVAAHGDRPGMTRTAAEALALARRRDGT